MKKIALSLITLGLLQSTAALATAPTPVPAAIAEHNGPIRIAVIRNLGSDDNTTCCAGAAGRQKARFQNQHLPEQRR